MKRESIKDILQNGGSVEVPFKSNIKDWFSSMKIYSLGSNLYIVDPYYQKFSNVDDAVDWFISKGLTSKNVGYVQSRLSNRGIDFESISPKETNSIIKEEGKIVDLEFQKIGIILNPFPPQSDAIKEAKEIANGISIDNLSKKLTDFENKYITLDPHLSLSFVYEYDANGKINKFESNVRHESFNRSVYQEHLSRPDIKYKSIKISIKIGSGEYISHNLNF